MVGQTVGKYRIIDRLGRGGMGTVYRAIDETLHREVAIKVLNAELNDPGVGRRFRAEAVAIARLNHPGIATIYELVQHEGQWLMVIEFVRGETLEAMIAREGALPPERAASIVVQVLSALTHAHGMGVVHRDLKPANIMATSAGATKIMDFGIARVAGTEHLTSAGFMMGTPAYMAPEQVMGGEIDARTDLYAIGVVLYFLVTAQLPFKGDTPMAMAESRIKDLPTPVRAVRPDLPAWFSLVMERALSRALDRRFQSSDEFREALRRGLAGLPIESPPLVQVPPELVATVLPGTLTVPPPTGTGSTSAPHASGAMPHPATAPVPQPPTTPVAQPATAPVVQPSTAPIAHPPTSPAPTPVVASGALRSTAPETVGAAKAGTGQNASPAPSAGELPPDLMPTMLANTSAQTAPAPTTPKVPVPAPVWANRSGLVAIAASVLLLAIVGFFVFRRSPPVPAPDPPAPTSAPVPSPSPAPPEAPTIATPTPPPTPVSGGPPSSGPASGTSSGTGEARGSNPVTTVPPPPPPVVPTGGTPPLPTGTTTSPGTPANTGAKSAGRGVTPNDPVVRYDRVRQLLVTGRNGEERDVLLFLGSGLISLVAMNDQGAGNVPYKDLMAATYVKAKDPKWDTSLPGPPTNLDVPGGMFRAARHWLVIQTKGAYAILRLDDSNWSSILAAIEARTGVKVARPD